MRIVLVAAYRSYLLLPVSVQFGPEQSSGPTDPENGALYVKQRLLSICFSPAIRIYKPTFGVMMLLLIIISIGLCLMVLKFVKIREFYLNF